jgi:hypothetical protein
MNKDIGSKTSASLKDLIAEIKKMSGDLNDRKVTGTIESLKSLGSAFESFQKLDGDRIAKNIAGLSKLETLTADIKGLIKTVSSDFRSIKTVEGFTKPLKDISSALLDFEKISVDKVSRNVAALNTAPNILLDLKNYIERLGSFSLSDSAAGFGRALEQISDGLRSFSTVSVKSLKTNVKALGGLTSEMGSVFTRMSNDFDGIDISELTYKVFEPFMKLMESFSALSQISIGKVYKNLKGLSFLPSLLKNTLSPLAANLRGVDFGDIGKLLGEPLVQLMSGLRALSELSIGSLIKNIVILPMLSSLIGASLQKLTKNLSSLSLSRTAKVVSEPLKQIADGFNEFAKIKFGKVIVSIGLMGLSFKMIEKFGALSSRASKFIPSVTKAVKSLQPLGKAMADIAETVGSSIGRFFGALGKNIANIAKGTLALSLVAGTLFVTGKAFSAFSDISWKNVLIGIAALGAVTLGIMGLGLLITGPQAALFAAGVGVLAVSALSLVGIGMSLESAAPGFQAFGNAIGSIIPQLSSLASIGPGLMLTATAIGVLSAAMVAFGTSSLFSSGTGLFGKILGINPVDKLKELAALGTGLDKTASALERIQAVRGGTRSDAVVDDLEQSDKLTEINKRSARGSSAPNNLVSARVENRSNSTTIFNNSWVPDKTSMFVLSPA